MTTARLRERIATLRQRACGLAALRSHFAARDILEVETPIWVTNPGLDANVLAVPVSPSGYLTTSPEFQMKRLLAAGAGSIYSVTKCFRAGERGQHHNPEFSMVEWYECGASPVQVMDSMAALIHDVARAVDSAVVVPPSPWPRVTVSELFATHVGYAVRGDESVGELADALSGAGVELGRAEHWDECFYTAFVERVDPVLSRQLAPLFVVDWPAPLAALARLREGEPVAERFELYAGGLELANGFYELRDPVEQRIRFENEQNCRLTRGQPAYDIDEKFLAALSEMPACTGVAMGLDRLFMWLLNRGSICDVLAFPIDEL